MNLLYSKNNVRFYHGDFRELEVDNIDAIITDPPYPKEYLPLYDGLFDLASRSLVDGGSLLTIVPHYALTQVIINSISYKQLKYRWIMAMWQQAGPHPRMAMGMEILWKPILWYVKRAWPSGRGFITDGFVNTPPVKKLHKWQQANTWAQHCLKVVPEGGLVLDPMMGSGTLPIVAAREGYQVIGVDNDIDTIEVAIERIEKLWQRLASTSQD